MGLDNHITGIKWVSSCAWCSVMDGKRPSEKDNQERREGLDLCVKEELA